MRHVTMVTRVMGMEVVFHVHLMNVVDQGTEGVGVLGNIVIHAHQT